MLELNSRASRYVDKFEAMRCKRATVRRERVQTSQLRQGCNPSHSPQERSTIHGTFTKPVRIA